jgi:hypothetical protein
MRAALAAAIAIAFALTLSTAAGAATTSVNSLADTDAPAICVLRDAIAAGQQQDRNKWVRCRDRQRHD